MGMTDHMLGLVSESKRPTIKWVGGVMLGMTDRIKKTSQFLDFNKCFWSYLPKIREQKFENAPYCIGDVTYGDVTYGYVTFGEGAF